MSHMLAVAVAVVLAVGTVLPAAAVPVPSTVRPDLVSDTQCLATADTVSGAAVTTAQAGCCARAGGVCGCSQGRAVCCDGRSSTTCACHRDKSRAAAPGDVAGDEGR